MKEEKKYVGNYEVVKIVFVGKSSSKIPTIDLGFLLPGESFFVPETDMTAANVSSTMSYARKKCKDGRVFVTRATDKDKIKGVKGTRVYRIK